MIIDVKFNETNTTLDCDFDESLVVIDGYDKGYQEGHADGYQTGYDKGNTDGYNKGHTDGLAERKYEIWTITLTTGEVIEKEVALL